MCVCVCVCGHAHAPEREHMPSTCVTAKGQLSGFLPPWISRGPHSGHQAF